LNFVGHALVATWQSAEPRFVLGSMLPDFAGMVGARLSSQAQDASSLGRGITLHHRTDELFHGADEFLDLMQDAMARLTALGVARGPARAIGHIGVEMLIDGELLAREPALAEAYESTLARSGPLDPAVFREQDGHESYRVLHHRLSAHGAPYDYRNVDAVTRRLYRMLAHRPRLALAETDAEHVVTALKHVQTRIPELLPPLLSRLATGTAPAP
jgi:hypothetical protein